jgi:hypothetical protein
MLGDLNDQTAFNRRMIGLLESLSVNYAIGGSVAAMAYSEPRFTVDVDMMIQVSLDRLATVIGEIENWGVYVDPVEAVIEFNIDAKLPVSVVDGLTGTKADLYVAQGGGLDVSAMERRMRLQIYDSPALDAWFLSPEDVILYKLDYFMQSDGTSQKHPIDIAKMIRTLKPNLDVAYIDQWAAQLNLDAYWGPLRDLTCS